VSDFDLSIALFGIIALTLGLMSRWLKQSFVSENAIALLIGILIGPFAINLIDISEWGNQHRILEYVTSLALTIALMEIALRLPKKEFMKHLRSYIFLLGALMPIMWIATGSIVWLLLDLPLWMALLIGAILTPTDPIVASSVVTGPVAERFLPTRLRDTLWAESGANDGLAFPIVMLPILVLAGSFSGALGEWALHIVVYETGFAAVIGAALGYGTARILVWAESHHTIERESFKTFTLALSITTLGVTSLAGTKGLLGVFVAGVIFHLTVGEDEDEEVEPIQGALDHFFTIPIFAVIGLTAPLDEWWALGWVGLALIAGVLLLRRLPGLMLISRGVNTLRSWPDTLFLGWFGPLGIGALYYAAYAFERTGHEEAWVVGTLVICASIIVHGMTATPFSYLYARYAPDEGRGKPSSTQ
jgi:sodium/hydrogen antiporter